MSAATNSAAPTGSERGTGELGWRSFDSTRVALPTLALTLGIVGGFIAVGALCLLGFLPLWAGGVLNFLLGYLAFTPLHEGVHGNIGGGGGGGRWRWLDAACGWACGMIILAPFPAFRAIHLRHHGKTNDPENDPDHWVAGESLPAVALRCLTIFPHYYWDFLVRMAPRATAFRKARVVSLASLAGQVVVVAVLCRAGYALETFALWVVPGVLASALLAFLFDYLPHVPHDTQERFHDTRVIVARGLGPLMMGQNYHLVHHLYPRIPFYRYGNAFWAMRDSLEEIGSPIVYLGDGVDRRDPARSGTSVEDPGADRPLDPA